MLDEARWCEARRFVKWSIRQRYKTHQKREYGSSPALEPSGRRRQLFWWNGTAPSIATSSLISGAAAPPSQLQRSTSTFRAEDAPAVNTILPSFIKTFVERLAKAPERVYLQLAASEDVRKADLQEHGPWSKAECLFYCEIIARADLITKLDVWRRNTQLFLHIDIDVPASSEVAG